MINCLINLLTSDFQESEPFDLQLICYKSSEWAMRLSSSPKRMKNEPPMTGSGTVTNKAPNLLNTPNTIMNTAATWTTTRLPTCNIHKRI